MEHNVMGHVLVLDDDDMVAATIGMVAESAGYRTTVTMTYDDFWSHLEAGAPTHVTLDLNMPGTDGIEVLRRLAVHGFRGSIVISSGLDRRVLDAARLSAEEHGLHIAGVLPKPFKAKDLVALLTVVPPNQRPATMESRRTPTAAELRRALDEHAITVAFQPKVQCATGDILGYEALARWTDPTLGPVSPYVFVTLAEREVLITRLTDVVLEAALTWLTGFDPHGTTHVSVNLSARSLTDLDLANRVANACDRHGLAAGRLLLELTETASTDDEVTALDVLTRFRIKGIPLSLDDFGTGHSTLVQLARQPFSELKIDRRFVQGAATSVDSQAIVRAMVGLAHGLKLTVTAEGVEDAWTYAFLNDIGCDVAQGYHVAKPMPGGEVAAWADGWRAKVAEGGREHDQQHSLET